MPPKRERKRVKIAADWKGPPGTKRDAKKQEMKDPIQRQGQNINTRDLKRTRNEYQQQADEARAERERNIKELRAKIDFLKRDSEKIVRNQQLKFGTTLDDMKTIQRELDQARAINDALLKEVEGKRVESDRLQGVMDDIVQKINEVMLEASDLNREKKTYEANKKKIERMETHCERLIKHNRDLRAVLLKNHLDPTADADAIPTPTPLQSPIAGKRRESSLPMIYTKKNLVREFRSLENLHKREISKMEQKDNFRKASWPVKVTETVYQMPNYKSMSLVLPRLKPKEIYVTV